MRTGAWECRCEQANVAAGSQTYIKIVLYLAVYKMEAVSAGVKI